MRFFFFLFFFFGSHVFCVDFDCIVIGSSPFSLFEALYKYHSGQRILILEEASECGGAWKAIDICGIAHADLGCHQIGQNSVLKDFLEQYAGCRLVSMDNPLLEYTTAHESPNGYYFSKGCFELIDQLLKLIQKTEIVLHLNSKAESVFLNYDQQTATVRTKDRTFTTSKLLVTPMSCLEVENPPSTQFQPQRGKQDYPHLYLLIQDPSLPRFSYRPVSLPGVSRLMNLTHFVSLTNTGQQLIVVQTYSESHLRDGASLLDAMKAQDLLAPDAYILKEESYIYQGKQDNQLFFRQINRLSWDLFELIQTGHFQGMANYVEKWKTTLKPYSH